jgi:integrase
MASNVARLRSAEYIAPGGDALNPPLDPEISDLLGEISGWSADMARLLKRLRETGMRLAEALHIEATDIHPCGTKATLRRGVKRNKRGSKVRTIDLGNAATILPMLARKERLFPGLSIDSTVVSTRCRQWHRQRQGGGNRAAEEEERGPRELRRFRIHDLRHAFAVASLSGHDAAGRQHPDQPRTHRGMAVGPGPKAASASAAALRMKAWSVATIKAEAPIAR